MPILKTALDVNIYRFYFLNYLEISKIPSSVENLW